MSGANMQPMIISLNELIEGSIDILKPIAMEKQIPLSSTVGNTTAYADQDMVRTILRNLIANSIKFTPTGGSVEISANGNGDMVQVTVTDTGIGMSADQADRVFALDQKTSTTGTAGEKGTGLGLPLCKDMLERNGGTIWVESTPGKGSRFHFTLPSGLAGKPPLEHPSYPEMPRITGSVGVQRRA